MRVIRCLATLRLAVALGATVVTPASAAAWKVYQGGMGEDFLVVRTTPKTMCWGTISIDGLCFNGRKGRAQ